MNASSMVDVNLQAALNVRRGLITGEARSRRRVERHATPASMAVRSAAADAAAASLAIADRASSAAGRGLGTTTAFA